MRKAIVAIALAGTVAGCGFFRKTFGISDSSPAHSSPQTTSIWGNWVLGTPTDSTAFFGAQLVEMTLDESRFTITADYQTRPDVVITGGVSRAAAGGLVTLDPQSGLDQMGTGTYVWRPGERVTLVASAAGDALLFALPRDMTARPTSTWYRKEAAEKAGMIPPRSGREPNTTSPQSSPPPRR
jgi:hypothetical protein